MYFARLLDPAGALCQDTTCLRRSKMAAGGILPARLENSRLILCLGSGSGLGKAEWNGQRRGGRGVRREGNKELGLSSS